MKLYIAFDMEGLAGISHWSQEEGDRQNYLDLIHDQVYFLIEGIQASEKNQEISLISLCDGHGAGMSLNYKRVSQMDPRIELISGRPRSEFMVHGIEGHDLAIFLGYHAGAGQHRASMDHTYSGLIHKITLNGLKCSEAMINSLYAKEVGVPVGLIIGDSGLYNQLIREGYMSYVEFVTTKQSIGRLASRHKNMQVLRKEIMEALDHLLLKDPKTLPTPDISSPYSLTIEFNQTDQADRAERMVGAYRLDGYRVGITLDKAKDILNTIEVMNSLARG